MIYKKNTKFAICVIMIIMLLGNEVARATSLNSVLNNTNTQITTTFDSGSSGYHEIVVNAYQYKNGIIKERYLETRDVTGGGTLKTIHTTKSEYVFDKYDGFGIHVTMYLNKSFKSMITL